MATSDDLVYLDHAATSPLRSEAREAMEPHLRDEWANPSGSHRAARAARAVIDEARDLVADSIGCGAGEVVFTSGGTEGANTAVLGAVRRHGGTAVCPATEHHAVLHCVEHAGGRVVGVDRAGRVDLDALADAVDDSVSVVSVMAVNNETGVVNDLAAVSTIVRERAPRAVLHTDAVQAGCWLDLASIWPHVDVLTLSSHKFGGPKGAGVMAVRDGVTLEPLLMGGGQERDRRSGTHNVAGIVGTAVSLAVATRDRDADCVRIGALRDRLKGEILARVGCAIDTVASSGIATEVSAGTAHMCLVGLENEELLYLLDVDGVCVSAASACASGAMEPSHVLAAMGLPRDAVRGSLRFSLGHTTSEADIDRAVAATVAAAERLVAARGTASNPPGGAS
ncbi:MAG: cysteine desulfurase family protein [Ilumatobacteraceae bacterium]